MLFRSRGRPPKADKDKAAAPKPKAPAQKPENAVKKEPEKKTAPTVQAAPAPKEPEKPKDAPRRGKEQIVYIKLNELHAFKNHPFEVRDDEEMRAPLPAAVVFLRFLMIRSREPRLAFFRTAANDNKSF